MHEAFHERLHESSHESLQNTEVATCTCSMLAKCTLKLKLMQILH